MKNNKLNIVLNFYLVGLLSIMMIACDDEKYEFETNFKFTIDAETIVNDVEGRAVFSDDAEINITKYCIFVYAGQDADSKLLHCEQITSLPAVVDIEGTAGITKYRAVLIGNCDINDAGFNNCKEIGVSTISDLNNATFDVQSTYNIPGTTASNNSTTNPDAAANAVAATEFTWSGYKDFSAERSIKFFLSPNMAKMTVTVNNKTSSTAISKNKLHVINLQIKNVSNKVLFAQNALSDCGVYQKPDGLGVIDYNIEKLELAPGESKTRTYYVPHNQVDAAGVTRPNGPSNATYIEVDGVRHQDYVDIAYKVYPGTKISNNLYDGNYHVLADHKYNVTINISNTGVTYDANNQVVSNKDGVAVEHVVLPTGTNCYMIHPKFTKTTNANGTVFELPIDRVNEYWEPNKITNDTEWRMYVIWQDIPSRSIYFTNKEGTTKTDYFSGKGNTPAYFKFDDKYKNLSSSTTSADQLRTMYGNILVGLTTDAHNGTNGDQYNCLWSWHLWVTDYNPDVAPSPLKSESGYNSARINRLYCGNSEDNSLTTAVPIDLQGYYFAATTDKYRPHGNVQHYYHARSEYWGNVTTSDEVWEGIYKDKWIMDRHLGSKAPCNLDLIEPLDAFGLYYQYGRKDPFTVRDTYNIAGSKRSSKWTNSAGPKTIADGVKKPNTFYTGSDYTTSSWASNGGSNPWYSPKSTKQGEKTLFDPCPAGWCLPVYDVYDFVKLAVKVSNTDLYEYTKYESAVLGNVLTIYYDAYNSSGGWGDPNRHMTVMTSLRYVNGYYYKLDASFAMQREINQKGIYEPFGAAGGTVNNETLAGCLYSLNGYIGLHGSGAGATWFYNGGTGLRPESGRYARKMKGTMDSHNTQNRGHVLGYTTRCIQDPYN